MKQLLLDVAPSTLPSFANFVPGPNREILAALQAMLSGERRERFLYLFGTPGSGKTHLLKAALAGVRETPGEYVACAGQTRFARELVARPLLAIDDVERLGEDGQLDLFHLFNEIRTRGHVLLASGNVAPGQLDFRADLATRIASMLAYPLKVLSDTDKATALKQRALERGFSLQDEVIEFLLRHWRRDLPSLISVLDRLDAYSLETHRPITVPLLKQAIADGGRR